MSDVEPDRRRGRNKHHLAAHRATQVLFVLLLAATAHAIGAPTEPGQPRDAPRRQGMVAVVRGWLHSAEVVTLCDPRGKLVCVTRAVIEVRETIAGERRAAWEVCNENHIEARDRRLMKVTAMES